MYWNTAEGGNISSDEALNSNIRCIEITFDKAQRKETYPLNSNIRCIEIFLYLPVLKTSSLLNSNIRCIEISPDR